MVGSLAAVFVMLAVASYLYQISPRWEHSEGFDVSYEIPAVSSDVDYFARQMEGEAGNLAADLFHDDKSGVELLSVEKQTNGSLRAVFRLQGINNEELQGFDREFSRQHSATRTQLEPRSWYSTSRLPGHMFENREVTINNQQLSFPRAFSSTEVTSLDRLFSSVQGNEVIVRGLRIGNEQKISVAEVVSLELDDKGNVIIQDVAGPHAGKPVLDYSEFTPEAD